MVNTKTQLVPAKHSKALKGALNYTTVTIHETGNESAGAGAQAHANLQARGNEWGGGWHETVDAIIAIISYSDTTRLPHAGKAEGNNNSYSIEICVNSKKDFVQAVRNAAERAAIKLKEKGYGVDRLRQHNGWSGKNCPTHLRAGDWGINWADFVDLVRQALNGVQIGDITPVPAPPAPAPTPPKNPVSPAATDDNRSLQNELKNMGLYSGIVDGVYGPMTRASVADFQTRANVNGKAGLFVDGIWGPISFEWFRWVKEAQQATRNFKSTLNEARPDGDYGPLFNKIVKKLQANNGLVADGVLGNVTAGWMRSKGSSLRNRP